MSSLIGLFFAVAAGDLSWQLASRAVANLPAGAAGYLSLSLVLVAVVVAFLAGSAVTRRAYRTREHLALFGAVAFGVCCGILGSLFTVALTASYVGAYATWPADIADQVLLVLAFPVLAALGFALAALLGAPVGLLTGGVLRVLAPRSR